MAGLAIRLPGVAEGRTAPAAGGMTGRALSTKMPGWFIAGMAGLAIGLSGMAEGCVPPTAGGVAGRALSAEVTGWFIA